MNLGIQGCFALVVGDNRMVASACADALRAEGATLLDPAGPRNDADILIATLADTPRIGIRDLDEEGLPLTNAWREVSALSTDLQAVLPNMLKRGFGRIVFIGSTAAKTLGVDDVVDRVAALGMLGLQKNAAGEFGENGITANSILYDRDSGPGEDLAANIAAACTYLASRQAAYLTGIVMTVDAARQRSVF